MKKAIVIAAISLALAGSAFAADAGKPENFEQKKAEVLKLLDEAKTCVQAAKNHDDFKACKEKVEKARERFKKEKEK